MSPILTVTAALHPLALVALVVVSRGGEAGGAVAGAIVDRPGGLGWAFAFAAGVLLTAALVASVPHGSIARADRRAADRLSQAMAAEPA